MATTQTADTLVAVFCIYEILIVACSVHGLPRRLMQRRAAAAALSTSGRKLSTHSARTVPATATTIQSERPCSAYRDTARGDRTSSTSTGSRTDEGCKRRLSLWNSCSWQASPCGESLLTWQVYRCRRIPSGNRSKGSVHG